MLRLRVRDSSGASHTLHVPQHATVAQLKAAVQQLTRVQPASQQLLVGFPPQSLSFASDAQSLTACGVRTGDTLTLGSSQSQQLQSPSRAMLLASMADDNSCLFHAISYCLSGAAVDGGWRGVRAESGEMRQLVSASIESLSTGAGQSSSPASSVVAAYLSSLPSVSSYAASMLRSDVWGGALECALLASRSAVA